MCTTRRQNQLAATNWGRQQLVCWFASFELTVAILSLTELLKATVVVGRDHLSVVSLIINGDQNGYRLGAAGRARTRKTTVTFHDTSPP